MNKIEEDIASSRCQDIEEKRREEKRRKEKKRIKHVSKGKDKE